MSISLTQRLPRSTFLLIGVIAAAFLILFDSVRTWHGDAIIHLSIAELLANGKGLTFNHGEPVVATTSFLWTAIITFWFATAGTTGAIWAIKALCILLWALAVAGTFILFRRAAPMQPWLGLGAAALFAATPGLLDHMVGGMETGLATCLFLAGAILVFTPRRLPPLWLPALIAALSVLARPEGVLYFGLLALVAWSRLRARDTAITMVAGVVAGILVTLAVNSMVTGTWAMDSGISRRAWAMRQSWQWGGFFFHPRTAGMFLAYFPVLGLGLGASTVHLSNVHRRTVQPISTPVVEFTLLVAATFFCFYSFIWGAVSTERYWTPFFPLLYGVGLSGFALVVRAAARRFTPGAGWLLAVVAVLWLGVLFGVEGRAAEGYHHTNLLQAVAGRSAREVELREALHIEKDAPFTIAMQEVQYRFFLPVDTNITVLGLDGRTVAHFERYVDSTTGNRDFERLFQELHPDFVTTHGDYRHEEPIMGLLQLHYEQRRSGSVVAGGFVFEPTALPNLYRVIYP